MAPRRTMELVTLKLTYKSDPCPWFEEYKRTKKTTGLKGSFSRVKNWFNPLMSKEVSHIPAHEIPYFMEWEISTTDASLFQINDSKFDKVYMIFGIDDVYWIYYNNNEHSRRLSGSGPLSFSYCGCCLNLHYKKVMEIIRERTLSLLAA